MDKNIASAIGLVGLTYLGFEYDSVWCFVGAVFCFFDID